MDSPLISSICAQDYGTPSWCTWLRIHAENFNSTPGSCCTTNNNNNTGNNLILNNNVEQTNTQSEQISAVTRGIENLTCTGPRTNIVKTNRIKENRACTTNMALRPDDYIGKYKGCPWRRRGWIYGAGVMGLHEEIEHCSEWLSPTQAEHWVRGRVVQRVRAVVARLWPEADVQVFGSFRTGLYLPTADIDIVVLGNWSALPLRTLEAALLNHGIAQPDSIKVLDRASVPIVKFTDRESDVRVDISFNVATGIESAELVKDFKRRYPCLPKLVFVLKQFLLERELNEVFTGGISSYCLILMVISFLQLHPRGSAWLASANLGVLLIEFFELYGRKFNYMTTAIRIRDGGAYVSKQDTIKDMRDGHRPSILCVEDPLTPGNDIGKSSYGAMQVSRVFCLAFAQLERFVNPLTPDADCNAASILGRIIRVTDQVIEYRNWLYQKFTSHLAALEVLPTVTGEDTQLPTPPSSTSGSNLSENENEEVEEIQPTRQEDEDNSYGEDSSESFEVSESNPTINQTPTVRIKPTQQTAQPTPETIVIPTTVVTTVRSETVTTATPTVTTVPITTPTTTGPSRRESGPLRAAGQKIFAAAIADLSKSHAAMVKSSGFKKSDTSSYNSLPRKSFQQKPQCTHEVGKRNKFCPMCQEMGKTPPRERRASSSSSSSDNNQNNRRNSVNISQDKKLKAKRVNGRTTSFSASSPTDKTVIIDSDSGDESSRRHKKYTTFTNNPGVQRKNSARPKVENTGNITQVEQTQQRTGHSVYQYKRDTENYSRSRRKDANMSQTVPLNKRRRS